MMPENRNLFRTELDEFDDISIAAYVFGIVAALGAGTATFWTGTTLTLATMELGKVPKWIQAIAEIGIFGADIAVTGAVYEPAVGWAQTMISAGKDIAKSISRKIVKAAEARE